MSEVCDSKTIVVYHEHLLLADLQRDQNDHDLLTVTFGVPPSGIVAVMVES